MAAGISSEQFVGEIGYAYKLGMPVANWEWLVLPSPSILLWVFVPLYVRYASPRCRSIWSSGSALSVCTVYAWLSVASYVFVNFAPVFYTGGFALEAMWGIDRLTAVWFMAAITGLYTVYGGLGGRGVDQSVAVQTAPGWRNLRLFRRDGQDRLGLPGHVGKRQKAHLMTGDRPSRGSLDGVTHPGPL